MGPGQLVFRKPADMDIHCLQRQDIWYPDSALEGLKKDAGSLKSHDLKT